MKFQIDSIILWPKNQNNEIQEIQFKPGKINIIHGLSRTGKSSVLHIIDYAMGATKCQIPIGTIRDKVMWFGVKVTLRGESWIIARKGPIDSTPSNDYYFETFPGSIPKIVPTKTNRSTFKDKFNNLIGVSDLPHSDAEKQASLMPELLSGTWPLSTFCHNTLWPIQTRYFSKQTPGSTVKS
ncbi:hypothetical protein V5O39_04045 [Pseudomonas parakoreensis]